MHQAIEQYNAEHNHEDEGKERIDPARLEAGIERYRKLMQNAEQRKVRTEGLMRRKSAKKWDVDKKQQMVRRLVTANKEIEQAVKAIEGLHERLEALKTQKKA